LPRCTKRTFFVLRKSRLFFPRQASAYDGLSPSNTMLRIEFCGDISISYTFLNRNSSQHERACAPSVGVQDEVKGHTYVCLCIPSCSTCLSIISSEFHQRR